MSTSIEKYLILYCMYDILIDDVIVATPKSGWLYIHL